LTHSQSCGPNIDGDGGEPPAAPNVRVINLSVCDQARPYDRGMSPWARLLDWLAWKYNLLFVVSAGNHPHDIELNVLREDFHNLSGPANRDGVIQAIAADMRHRRMLSPSESINALSLGATHTIRPHRLPYLDTSIPSCAKESEHRHCPWSRYRRSIKT